MGIAPQWFDKRRGLALGVATSGSGIGGLIMPFIMSPLLETLGAPWCYRILGFIALAVGLFASIFIKERYPHQQRKKFTELMNFAILKEPNFAIWNIACDLCLLGYLVPFYLMPSKKRKQIPCWPYGRTLYLFTGVYFCLFPLSQF
jgi:MFS family permease